MLPTKIFQEEQSSLTRRIKYENRADLTYELRTKIACIAKWGKNHGRITRLSVRYSISRTTVYVFRDRLESSLLSAFSAPKQELINLQGLREATIRQILLLRLTGHCCLLAISQLLKIGGFNRHSTGFISETLDKIGKNLSPVIAYQGTVTCASDEIFYMGSVPILVSVEPVSGAILQIQIGTASTLKADWTAHWANLRAVGITPARLVSDEGWMLRAARMEEVGMEFQPDTFHAVSHRLGIFAKRLEKEAYQAIETEYERQNLCENTKQANRLPLFKQQLTNCQEQTQQAISRYEDFRFLYRCLLQQFNVFDRNGLPRKRLFAQQEAQCALELLRELAIPNLNKEVDMIVKLMPDLFAFLDKAQDCCQKIRDSQLVEEPLLPFWCTAWQYQKKAFKVKNNYQLQKQLFEKSKNWMLWIEQQTPINKEVFNDLQASIFARFDGIVQSSAAVEMVNAVLRPFLNQARDQVSQNTLNLIMHFYNHRRFDRGKRKGKSPFELLWGRTQDKDWLDSIIDIVRLHNI